MQRASVARHDDEAAAVERGQRLRARRPARHRPHAARRLRADAALCVAHGSHDILHSKFIWLREHFELPLYYYLIVFIIKKFIIIV